MRRELAIGVLGLLLAAGCSAPSTNANESASSSVTGADAAQPSAYERPIGSLADLRDAYVVAGGSCDQFTPNDAEPTGQGASCDGVYLSWFDDPQLVDTQLGQRLGNPYDGPALVGDNWIVYSQDAALLEGGMGGTVRELAYA